MIFVITSIILILLGCFISKNYKSRFGGGYEAGIVMIIFGSIFLLALIVVLAVAQVNSIKKYATVSAYIESGIYEEYSNIIQSQIDAGVIGDISNIETGKVLVGNLQEWYERIESTNKEIRYAKSLNNSWVFDWFCYDWPEYPELIDKQKIRELQFNLTKDVNNMSALPIINLGVGK